MRGKRGGQVCVKLDNIGERYNVEGRDEQERR